MPRAPRQSGFSVIELMFVLVIIGVLAAIVISRGGNDGPTTLQSVAHSVAADLSYAQSLAVANASRYTVTFELASNRYVLRHSGADSALNTLPLNPLRKGSDSATEHWVDLDELPRLGATVRLHRVESASNGGEVGAVEFGPLGATTTTADTIVWLVASGTSTWWYAPIRINATTGLATVGDLQSTGPTPSGAVPSADPVNTNGSESSTNQATLPGHGSG